MPRSFKVCPSCLKGHRGGILECNSLKTLKNPGCIEAVFMEILAEHLSLKGFSFGSVLEESKAFATDLKRKRDSEKNAENSAKRVKNILATMSPEERAIFHAQVGAELGDDPDIEVAKGDGAGDEAEKEGGIEKEGGVQNEG